MHSDGLLDTYLSVLGLDADPDEAQLRHGQFHDVVLAGDVAYRFPRDEESRRALPAHVALLEVLDDAGAAGAGLPAEVIPAPLAKPDLSQPVGRCHVALRRLSGQHLSQGEACAPGVLAELARLLDALGELGRQTAIAAAVPPADPRYWARVADDVG